MASLVYEWTSEGPSDTTLFDCLVVENPEVNATAWSGNGGTADTARELLVGSWNRQFPQTQHELKDFDFQPRPDGWEPQS